MPGVSLQKSYTERDRKYLAFIRSLPCLICQRPGPSHAHHESRNRGMAIKGSDYEALPLCPTHHTECHQKGKHSFWLDTDIILIQSRLKAVYESKH